MQFTDASEVQLLSYLQYPGYYPTNGAADAREGVAGFIISWVHTASLEIKRAIDFLPVNFEIDPARNGHRQKTPFQGNTNEKTTACSMTKKDGLFFHWPSSPAALSDTLNTSICVSGDSRTTLLLSSLTLRTSCLVNVMIKDPDGIMKNAEQFGKTSLYQRREALAALKKRRWRRNS